MEHPNAEKILEKLFNENFHALVFSSFRIVNDYEQAKDIVQNVFVKIWQNFDKVEGVQNPKSYLFTAVKNSSLNFLRDLKTINKEETEIDLLNSEEQREFDEEDKDLITKVHQAVDKLPDNWKEAFILSKYEKLKYYEIAEVMNISNKTVEKYISKALAFLRLEVELILILIMMIFFSQKV